MTVTQFHGAGVKSLIVIFGMLVVLNNIAM